MLTSRKECENAKQHNMKSGKWKLESLSNNRLQRSESNQPVQNTDTYLDTQPDLDRQETDSNYTRKV